MYEKKLRFKSIHVLRYFEVHSRSKREKKNMNYENIDLCEKCDKKFQIKLYLLTEKIKARIP